MNFIASVLEFGEEPVENGLRNLIIEALVQFLDLVIEQSDLVALMELLLLLLLLRSEVDAHQV